MKNKYTIGPNGNLISESFISNILNEQGKSAAELAAEARAKRAASGSAQPATTTTTKTASNKSELEKYKDIVYRANFRIFEHVLYDSIFKPLMIVFWTGTQQSDINRIWDSKFMTTKKDYFRNLTSQNHPFKVASGYWYWYKPAKKELYGPADTFKANIEGQDGWIYNNIWLPVITDLRKIPYYNNNKDTDSIKKVFDNVYKEMDKISSAWYEVNPSYQIEIKYVSSKLLTDPDEVSTYFEHVNATPSTLKYKEFNSMTLLEQFESKLSDTILKGIFPKSDKENWSKILKGYSYVGSIKLSDKWGIKDYVPLRAPTVS